jgi:hypothetical protein
MQQGKNKKSRIARNASHMSHYFSRHSTANATKTERDAMHCGKEK